jgi:hypothetical protein
LYSNVIVALQTGKQQVRHEWVVMVVFHNIHGMNKVTETWSWEVCDIFLFLT